MRTTLTESLKKLYCDNPDELKLQNERLERLIRSFTTTFGDIEYRVLSTPGRTELSGNHTDHNRGKVLAAGINLDTIAIAAATENNTIKIYSEEFRQTYSIDISDPEPKPAEKETTAALIRGIVHGFIQKGYSTGGFVCYLQSDVSVGSGLSSSASVEVLLGSVLNTLYNNEIDPVELAKIGQYAENKFFGKPCGLMDQIACAVGGVVGIDFQHPENPAIEEISLDLNTYDYKLLIVDTGSSHHDLTPDYAAVPQEMIAIAESFGKSHLRDVTKEELLGALSDLRSRLGERPLLRALHFYEENERVTRQIQCLRQKDFAGFLDLVNESGNSSIRYLQNIYSPQNPKEQPVTLALALTENFIKKTDSGAARIHGGGFAGTIQVFLPASDVGSYKEEIERVYGKGCVRILTVRNTGTINLL